MKGGPIMSPMLPFSVVRQKFRRAAAELLVNPLYVVLLVVVARRNECRDVIARTFGENRDVRTGLDNGNTMKILDRMRRGGYLRGSLPSQSADRSCGARRASFLDRGRSRR